MPGFAASTCFIPHVTLSGCSMTRSVGVRFTQGRTLSTSSSAMPKPGASISRFNAERWNGSVHYCANQTALRRFRYCEEPHRASWNFKYYG